MSKYRVDFGSIPWESPIDGIRHKIDEKNGKRLRLVEYTGDMEPHWCEKGHIGYILEGEMEIIFEQGTTIFRGGDGVFIPPGKEHRHMGRVLTDVVRAVFVEEK